MADRDQFWSVLEMAAIYRFLNSHGLGCLVVSRPARHP